jgi:DeoR family fructose operon transcriptional repressor
VLTPERQERILALVNEKGFVKLQELVEETGSSESTIRRDLVHLEKMHYIKRVHGGAASLQTKGIEPSMHEKSAKNLQEKKAIASAAAAFIKDGDCIYLDAGSTTYEMIPYLKGKPITVVTNGLMHIEALFEADIRAYLVGGMMKSNTRALIGSAALESLNRYRFDACFIGANGIHHKYGYTTPDPEEALIKKSAMELSGKSYIVADQSKFSEIAFSKIAEIEKATIITNGLSKQELAIYEKKTAVKVVNI